MASIKQVLADSQLCRGFSDAELEKIAKICHADVYEAGETIFREGDLARNLYIVEDGKVALEMTIRVGPGGGRHGTIDVITEGQVFGAEAVGEVPILTTSARCIRDSRLVAVDAESLSHLLDTESRIGPKILKRLHGVANIRLEHARDTLAHVLSISSHDLKAPLAAVESYNRVMLDGYAGEITEKQRTMLLRSSDRIRGLLSLIDNILDISRIDTGDLKMEATSLLEVVESTIATIRPLAEGKGLQLEVRVPGELPPICGSPTRLQQVFTNLLGNAVKFTPSGGVLTLEVREEDEDILVEVTDTGMGISPEELPQIFGDFYRGVRVDSSGAGLGLSISKKIVEAHGGKIWAESPCPESGTGSKFTFTLPKQLAATKGGVNKKAV